jgi:DNA-binding transcriptional LysR family regulator
LTGSTWRNCIDVVDADKYCFNHLINDKSEIISVDRLQTMKSFVRVVDEGSFAAAARFFECDQALVTRQIADLERHLGVRLLERTTRSMRLTEAGETYLSRCRGILEDVEETEALISQSHRDMVGKVRIGLPTLFNLHEVAFQLTRLAAEFPQINIEIAMFDHAIDPVTEGFDVITMNAKSAVSSMAVARPLLDVPLLLCVSPAYLQQHSMPATPAELANHHCVTQWATGDANHAREHWLLVNDAGERDDVEVQVALRTNSYALGLEAVRCGLGVGRIPASLITDELESGQLVQLLPDWRLEPLSLKLVYPGRRMMPRRVRYVIDTILAQRDQATSAID